MVNNLIDKIEKFGIDGSDPDLVEAYERNVADKVYFERKEGGRKKEEQQNSCNRLKDISDRKDLNPGNIFFDIEEKRHLLSAVMGYKRFDDAEPAQVGKVFLKCYNSAKLD